MTKRFKLYDEETLDTHIEDNEDCYSDGTPKSYWFGENEDFCNLFYKLNELSDENLQLKQQLRNSVELFRKDSVTLFELKEENKELKVNYKELRYANNIYCNKIDSLKKENEQLKKENLDLLEDLAYYKTKSASLEVDYLQYQKVNSGEVTTKKTIT